MSDAAVARAVPELHTNSKHIVGAINELADSLDGLLNTLKTNGVIQ